VFKAATKKQKYEKISEKKSSTTVETLCKVSRGYFEQLTFVRIRLHFCVYKQERPAVADKPA